MNCAKLIINIRKTFFYCILSISSIAILGNCYRGDSNIETVGTSSKKDLVSVNKFLVKKNHQNIVNFVHRKGWDMKETSTGLWYMIYRHGAGKAAGSGEVVTFNYSISLLDGQFCYTSDSLGPKSFKIGNGHVESGLEEAILLLHEGDKARLIMPPHLAYGLPGDNNKIPPQSTILYDISVLHIK